MGGSDGLNKKSKVSYREQSKGVVAEVHIEYDGAADEVPDLETQSSEAYELYLLASNRIQGAHKVRQLDAVRNKL